jgi:hypothetical protein
MAKGDHIQVKRLHGLYYHHGIDMGDGTVIHFSGEPLNGKLAKVCLVTDEEFLKGEKKQVVSYKEDAGVLDPEETIALARDQLDTEGYHVLYNNCEHFATYCKTKRKKSKQVRNIKKSALAVGGTATAFAAVVLMNQVKKRNKTGLG